MNLQKIGMANIESMPKTAKLFGKNYTVGYCHARKGVVGSQCNNQVTTETGYADLDGYPFKAYYCADCARKYLEGQS